MSTRQAAYNRRRHRLRRMFRLCTQCGQPMPCGRKYCGRNAERTRERQKLLMRKRRAAAKKHAVYLKWLTQIRNEQAQDESGQRYCPGEAGNTMIYE
jgi:hypothetical protein